MIELPAELRRTVQIMHPRYEEEFRKLDPQWVSVPALSRLGFDVGSKQYTASTFMGWFMDSEIGVRDLADTFRYDTLPDIVDALGLSPEPETALDDLPEYMHMIALVCLPGPFKIRQANVILVKSTSGIELCSLLLILARSCHYG